MKKFLSIVMLVSLLTNEISAINLGDISVKATDCSKNALEATKTLVSNIGKDTCNFVSEHKYGVAAAGLGLLSICVYRYLSPCMEKVRQAEIARQAEIDPNNNY